MQLKYCGLRYNTTTGFETEPVTINVDNKEDADLVMAYLSWSWRENWRTWYKVPYTQWPTPEEQKVMGIDPNRFKLPEGYHIEVSLVKNTK